MTFDERSAPAGTPVGTPAYPSQHPTADATAADEDAEPRKKQGSMVREIVETLLLALFIFLAVRAVVLNFRVDGTSMIPNLQNDEMVLVNRNAYLEFDANALVNWLPFVEREGERILFTVGEPERGDIVVINAPVENADKPYIKRVIGLPGETVEARDGVVYVDGVALPEEYIVEPTWCGVERACAPVTVPEDSVFVMGDNRDNSSDSRSFGTVPYDNIVGKAWLTYWPTDEIGLVPHEDYPARDEPEPGS